MQLMTGKKHMLKFVAYLMTFCGMALIFISASASDSDLPLSIVMAMGIGGLIVFVFGVLIGKGYENE